MTVETQNIGKEVRIRMNRGKINKCRQCKNPMLAYKTYNQRFCSAKCKKEYWQGVMDAGKRAYASKERKERMRGVRAVTQDMTPQERKEALIATAKAVFTTNRK